MPPFFEKLRSFEQRPNDVAKSVVNDPVPEIGATDQPGLRIADGELGEIGRPIVAGEEFVPQPLQFFVKIGRAHV